MRQTHEYFETMKLEESSVVCLGDNKVCTVHGICTTRLKMFDDLEFLLYHERHVLKLKQNLLTISIFDDLGYCTRIDYWVFKNSYGEVIITKETKICGLYILECSNIVIH